MAFRTLIRTYYYLTKPGIIYGNVMTAAGGFLLASKWHVNARTFAATILGMSLVIASACVFNNFMDRDIDKKMARTRKRALVRGTVSGPHALMYATALGFAGFAILVAYVNMIVVLVGVVGFVDYVALYDISKRRSLYGTLVGSISGAAPVVAGYCAATDRFDGGAFILFLILVLWQMPHFYAIAMFRSKDYAAASIPVLPLKQGFHAAKVQIVSYVVAFCFAVSALTAWGYAGYSYLAVMLAMGLSWLTLGVRGFQAIDDVVWARQMFFFSLVVIMSLSVMLALGNILP
jgi:protoheme IX farnesyltransferase